MGWRITSSRSIGSCLLLDQALGPSSIVSSERQQLFRISGTGLSHHLPLRIFQVAMPGIESKNFGNLYAVSFFVFLELWGASSGPSHKMMVQ